MLRIVPWVLILAMCAIPLAPALADVVDEEEEMEVPPPPPPPREPAPPPPAPAPPPEEGWVFEVAPYAWFLNLDGESVLGGREADVDRDLADLGDPEADSLFGGAVWAEARKDRFGLFLHPTYARLDFQESWGGVEGEWEGDAVFLEGGIFYRLVEADLGDGDRQWWLDGLLGARWTYLEADVDFSAPLSDFDEDRDWVDPFVGARLGVPLTDRVNFSLRGDVGGFDVGSELSWQAMATLGYELGERSEVFLGYRALDQRYVRNSGSDRFRWDVTMHGPVVGMGLRF